MGEKNVFDVSSFMLFEATGDSEADSELNTASVNASYGIDVEPDYGDHDDDDEDDDDDAESCSYNWLERKPIFELKDDRRRPRDHNGDDDDDKSGNDQDGANVVDDDRGNSHDDQEPHHVDDGDDDDDDEVVMKSTAKTRQHKKARLCVDSTMGLLNDMEKNRLFWEACLAS